MAKINLFKSANLTAPTSYRHLDMYEGRIGEKAIMYYSGGMQLRMIGYGDDSVRDLDMYSNGAKVFEMDAFYVALNSRLENALFGGNMLPVYQAILAGADRVTGSSGADKVAGFGGHDWLSGNAGHDWLSGDAGNDTLIGGAGNDTLLGGDGNDTIAVGSGADLVTGGAGIDTIQFGGLPGVKINLASTAAQSLGAAGSVKLAGIESVLGTAGADRITGTAAANTLTGGAGNDLLDGAAGNDVLVGGAGNDVLKGGAGADRLTGGAGSDVLTGGADADRFIFAKGAGADRIVDFQNGLDRIEIASGAERFADLSIIDSGQNAVIRYGADTITVLNIDHKLIDAADFIFT